VLLKHHWRWMVQSNCAYEVWTNKYEIGNCSFDSIFHLFEKWIIISSKEAKDCLWKQMQIWCNKSKLAKFSHIDSYCIQINKQTSKKHHILSHYLRIVEYANLKVKNLGSKIESKKIRWEGFASLFIYILSILWLDDFVRLET
jgi:hypothetical protein